MKRLLTTLALPAISQLVLSAAERPNIIYIMTDQQTATAMSCAGNKDLHTPNMDRMAQNGVRFENAYCTAPLSGPSRFSMFTGRFPSKYEMQKNHTEMPEELKTITLGNLMAESGYECMYAGKWHVPELAIPDQQYGFKQIHPNGDFGLSEACVEYLNGKHQQPFFLVASFINPHNICEYVRHQNLPFGNIPEADIKDCPGIPFNFNQNPYDADVIEEEREKNYRTYPSRRYTVEDWRQYINTYYRLVEKVDQEIGKIVDAIDKHNLWKNTIVIFASDHGDGAGAHNWNQKSALYEEVVNVPFIVTLPGKKNAGKVLPQLVSTGVDLFASICDWANVKLPKGADGVSFRKVMEAGDASMEHQNFVVTETMFDGEVNSRGWMLRTPKYKYVLYDKGKNREQLFDMTDDRGEMRNLVVENAYRKVLDEHRSLLNEWMKKNKVKPSKKTIMEVPGIEMK